MSYHRTRRDVLTTTGVAIVGGAAIGTASASGEASGEVRNFVTQLTSEAHEKVDTNAQGQAIFQLRDGELRFMLIVANIEDVVMAHVHLDEVLGPIAVWLHDVETGEPAPVEGRVSGVLNEGTITDELVERDSAVPERVSTVHDLVEEMNAENAWVNVHTEAFPDGEIGGQVTAAGEKTPVDEDQRHGDDRPDEEKEEGRHDEDRRNDE